MSDEQLVVYLTRYCLFFLPTYFFLPLYFLPATTMPVPAVTTSAAGSLTLLEDPDKDIRVYALNHLLSIVGQFWAEMSDKLPYL